MKVEDNDFVPEIPVSWGELFDKITILEIKESQLGAFDAVKNVKRELDALRKVSSRCTSSDQIVPYIKALRSINQKLWNIEDAIRLKEAANDFGPEFVDLARAVYISNDERASIKRKINHLTNSHLIEEKSYKS